MEEYDLNLDEALGVAMEAAQSAGNIMWKFYQRRHENIAAATTRLMKEGGNNTNINNTNISNTINTTGILEVQMKSSSTDLVTEYDKLCDETITRILKKFNKKVEHEKHEAGFNSFKMHFITEEISPDTPLTDAPTWIVDPIDGTMSFVHGGCDCCVSIGLTIHKKTVLAVVYCPFLISARTPLTGSLVPSGIVGEMFTAIRGRGSFLNGFPIRVYNDSTIKNAVVVFNTPMGARLSNSEKEQFADNLEVARCEKHRKVVELSCDIRKQISMFPVQGVRSYGASVFILAQVAAGRVDLYMEPAGMIWDVCAGSLLVSEAGGIVKNMWGNEFTMSDGSTTIVAAANKELSEFGIKLCTDVNYGDYWKM